MANIDLSVTMENGTGLGMKIFINSAEFDFDQTGTQSVTLAPGKFVATVIGHEPSGADVRIDVLQGPDVIGHTFFTSPLFSGFIKFTVQ